MNLRRSWYPKDEQEHAYELVSLRFDGTSSRSCQPVKLEDILSSKNNDKGNRRGVQ